MELRKVSIYNFRSISVAEDINLSNYTILVGKNNEGKTNVLSAIGIAIGTIDNPKTRYDVVFFQRGYFRDFEYNLERDYPVKLNCGDYSKMKPTIIRLDFQLSSDEIESFKKKIGIDNNGTLGIEIQYVKSDKFNYFVPKFLIKGKKGKGAKSYQDNMQLILEFISENFVFTYIPAVRTSEQSMDILQNIVNNRIGELREDTEYSDALKIIEKKENDLLESISKTLTPTLKKFLPDVKNASINTTRFRRSYSRNSWSLMIDDGNNTDIASKGDGIKSLAAIALLKGTSANKGFVAIEEPESHLHSGAIHKLDEVLKDISKNQQVLITTHNSCFVNSNRLEDNIVVSNGKCNAVKSLASLREELGISLSETLIISDHIIIVEGESDVKIYKRILSEINDTIRASLENKNISIVAAGSSSKVYSLLKTYESWIIKTFAIFDSDQAGLAEVKNMGKDGKNNFAILPKRGRLETEIEDLLPFDILKDVVYNVLSIDIDNQSFKKDRAKFCVRLENHCSRAGYVLTDNDKVKIKTAIADKILNCHDLKNVLDQDVINYFQQMIPRIIKEFSL